MTCINCRKVPPDKWSQFSDAQLRNMVAVRFPMYSPLVLKLSRTELLKALASTGSPKRNAGAADRNP